ncbi:hypothetical protein B0H11DRAFT_771429 [Mycena galericulata]|nr:hypothetical protein B0H11DRAFT_771429 [Mycena galericulata]
MSRPLVDQLQSLLAQLQHLDLEDPPPSLQQHLLTLGVAASATQEALQKDGENTNQVPDPCAGSTLNQTATRSESLHTSAPVTSPSKFPWVPVSLDGMKPSETAYSSSNITRQFGMPLSGVLPLEPPLHLFHWPSETISKLGKPEVDQLIPAPAAPPPVAGLYPDAPVYTLNAALDHSYRRGWIYSAPYYTSDRAIERDRMLQIQIPPNVRPARFDTRTRSFRCDPIPGMVRLPMGIPLVHHINGDPKRAVTAVCGHTLDSLMQYDEGEKVRALIPRLMTLTWGIAKTDTDPGLPGVFELDGMQRNLRSKFINLSNPVEGDGSFNLASTHGEGEGHGAFMPAVQTNTPQAAATIKELLQILHQLYRLIMPLCVSRFEWDMIEFNGRANNVVACGGFDPGPTSVQLNASSAANVVDLDIDITEDEGSSAIPPMNSPEDIAETELDFFEKLLLACLEASIGAQGNPHGDMKDDAIAWTLFVLMFRLAPGSDLGTFLWMRGAIYLREIDQYILFTSFKGHDIHCGQSPTYVKKIQEAWISMATAKDLFKRFGPQVRCGYVLYLSRAATTHSTQIQYSPSLNFLYSPASNDRDSQRKYYCRDGETILGDDRARANRLGHEGIYGLRNYLLQCRLKLGIDVNTLLKQTTYIDESGNVQSLEPTLLDIENDQTYEMVSLYRQYYHWLMDLVADYSLGLTKAQFKKRQAEIRQSTSGDAQHRQILPTERNIFPRRQRSSSQNFPLVSRVVSRRQHGGHGVWTVILEDSSEEREFVEQKARWLLMGVNREMCIEYMKIHGQRAPPAKSFPGSTSHRPDLLLGTGPSRPSAMDVDSLAPEQNQARSLNSGNNPEVVLDPRPDPSNTKRETRKRKPPQREEPSDLEPSVVLSSDSESSQNTGEFEVDHIVATRELDGTREWRVRWKDCDSSEDTWARLHALRGARDLVEQFNTSHGLTLPPFSPSSSRHSSVLSSSPPTPSPASSEDEYESKPKGKGKAPNARMQRINRTFNLSDKVHRKLAEDELDTKFLDDLLDSIHLQIECGEVEVATGALMRPSDFRLANDSPRTIASRIVDQIDRNNELSTQMYFELPSASSTAWGSRLAHLTIACIADVGASIPDMVAQTGIHSLVARGIQAQVCRSLVAVYQWIVNLGPSLADQLVAIHKEQGPEALAQQFSDLAPLVDYVVKFVRAHQRRQQLDAEAKALAIAVSKKTNSAASSQRGKGRGRGRPKKFYVGQPLEPSETPEQPAVVEPLDTESAIASQNSASHPQDLIETTMNSNNTNLPDKTSSEKFQIPADLFGLLPRTSSMITLEALNAQVRVEDDDALYRVSAKYLCKIWDEHLILKPMVKVDQYLNPTQRISKSRDHMESVRDRCITRGAILQSIADVFGDGLFACDSMRRFLHRPCQMFTRAIHRDRHFARAVEADERETLQVLDSYLIGAVVENPELEGSCAKLGELVHRGLLSLKLGHLLSDEEYENPHELLAANNTLLRLASASNGTKKRKYLSAADDKPTLESLLPQKPSFGIAAVIIREALSQRRQKPETPETTIYRRMLEGKHPMTGATTKRDPDQMDPIRADLQGLRLLRNVLPTHLLTTASGLSSLLVFMGTGQGTMTADFLRFMSEKKDKMHFTSLKGCVDQFSSIEARPTTLGPSAAMKCDNSAIYGQPNTWYTLHPSIRVGPDAWTNLSLQDKFEPYFAEELQRSWIAFLGPLANEDPVSSKVPRKSWEDVVKWILQSNLRGFCSGLAPLQFANNIVLAGIATTPSPAAMAQWIFTNKGYGAFAGLCVLGFNLPKKASASAVRAAFMCFYCWLDHHLTAEDKQILRFDAIFVEQLLCKIGRWKGRMKEMANKDLDSEARQLLDEAIWERGANLKDHTKFPFPSTNGFSISVFRGIVEGGLAALENEADMDVE